MALTERRPIAAEGESWEERWRRAQAEIRALGGQVAGITDELRELARREATLARAEAQDNVAVATQGAAFGGGAGVLTLYVLGFLGLALTFGLAEFMPLWVSALITAVLFGLAAATLGTMAKSRFNQFSLTPQRTLRSLREDMQWARAQMKRNAQ
jgi:hypothetical protein